MYILSCLNPCCLYKQNKNMYYYPPHFPPKWERSYLCMAIPCIALRESSLWVPRRLGRIRERVFIVTKLLHGFLGSLYALLYDFILAAIEWAQRDIRFWFRVSIPQLQYIYTTHTCWGFSFVWLVFFVPPPIFLFSLPVAVKRPTALLTLHLVCTLRRKKNILNMMPAEPGALISYMRTQICTFCQSGGGFPTETRDWVSQNLNLKFNNEMKTSSEP